METLYFDMKKDADRGYEAASDILRSGGLVAFPTETVYGLGGNALDSGASAKIYAAKGRPSDNPLIVHVADRSMVLELARELDDRAERLMDAFWPGPLTIVLKKKDIVPYETTGGLDTVAVRMPDDEVALGMIKSCGLPVAAPSANTSGRPSPTTAAHVAEDLDGKIDCILDGGSACIGVESTIVDLTGDTAYLLRPGYITLDMLRSVIGEVMIDPALVNIQQGISMDAGAAPKAPGMKYRHYAPRAELTLVSGEREEVREMLTALLKKEKEKGLKTAVICESKETFEGLLDVIYALGSREDLVAISRKIYDVLRDCDKQDIDVIYADDFGMNTDAGFGYAVFNRLIKAAGGHMISGLEDRGN